MGDDQQTENQQGLLSKIVLVVGVLGAGTLVWYYLRSKKEPTAAQSTPTVSQPATQSQPVQASQQAQTVPSQPPVSQTEPEPLVPSKPPIRYLRVARTDNRADYVNITGLELWSGGSRQRAVDGTVSPYPSSNVDPKCCDWKFVDDGDTTTVGHTDLSAQAYIELDFGASGKPGDTVKVLNRPPGSINGVEVLSIRLKGCTLTATDVNNKVVLSKPLGKELVYTFSLP